MEKFTYPCPDLRNIHWQKPSLQQAFMRQGIDQCLYFLIPHQIPVEDMMGPKIT